MIHQPGVKLQKEPLTNGARTHVPQGKAHGPQKVGRNFSTLTPQKRIAGRNLGELAGKEGDPHYVDPPQEFFFKSTKEAKYVFKVGISFYHKLNCWHFTD